MEFKPHKYQKYAIDYIIEHPISALILDMGLGKTVITLTAIEKLIYDTFDTSKVLVVAPLRVAKYTWKDEIEKWNHLSHLTYSIAVGSEKERIDALRKRVNIHIINRENLEWLIDKSGMPFDYDLVVLDELSSFKNWQSKRCRAFFKVRPRVERVIGLTGTPASNGLMDLYAEFRCLDMGKRLGRFITHYRDAFFTPDKRNGQRIFSYKIKPGADENIYSRISDITLSMKAIDYLEMPELVSCTHIAVLSEDEKEKYNALKGDLILSLKGEEITAENAASLTLKLTQLSSGAVYTTSGEVMEFHDQKLKVLEDLVEAQNGKPLLVAYWFKHDKARIEKALKAIGIEAKTIKSAEEIKLWNEGRVQVGLIHPASSGHGLNLQSGGNHLVWFSLPWSLELYDQTNARLWRQGQNEKSVFLHHIVTKGTIDERILKVLKAKESVQKALLDAVKAELGESV